MDRLIGKCDYINTNMRGLVDTRCCTETRAELDGQEPFPYDYRVRLPAAVPLFIAYDIHPADVTKGNATGWPCGMTMCNRGVT